MGLPSNQYNLTCFQFIWNFLRSTRNFEGKRKTFSIYIYIYFRAICNLTKADSFDGMSREIAPPVIERLRRTYAHVDDIDLFTGMVTLSDA